MGAWVGLGVEGSHSLVKVGNGRGRMVKRMFIEPYTYDTLL